MLLFPSLGHTNSLQAFCTLLSAGGESGLWKYMRRFIATRLDLLNELWQKYSGLVESEDKVLAEGNPVGGERWSGGMRRRKKKKESDSEKVRAVL